MNKKMGEDIARTADPNRLKGYSIPYDILLSNKAIEKMEEVVDVLSDCICLSKILLRIVSPSFLEVAEHLPTDGK